MHVLKGKGKYLMFHSPSHVKHLLLSQGGSIKGILQVIHEIERGFENIFVYFLKLNMDINEGPVVAATAPEGDETH
jgi:hypothetical protein